AIKRGELTELRQLLRGLKLTRMISGVDVINSEQIPINRGNHSDLRRSTFKQFRGEALVVYLINKLQNLDVFFVDDSRLGQKVALHQLAALPDQIHSAAPQDQPLLFQC